MRMVRIVVEEDKFLRILRTVFDPATPPDQQRAFADFFAHDEPDFAGWCDRLRARVAGLCPAEIVFAADQADLRRNLPAADAVIVESLTIGEPELALAPRLRVVQKFGAFARNIDIAACRRHGVAVETLRRRVNVAVAELAVALMLALAHRLCGRGAAAQPSAIARLRGAVLGLIGMGEIGREIAQRARALEMQVRYFQRRPLDPPEEAALGASYVGFPELMERSDVICVQLPLNASTRGFVDRAALQRTKRGAILVNVARAELVDRDALYEALGSGQLGGLGLDVGYEEPASSGEKLLTYPNVICLPHIAVGARQNALADVEEMCLKLWRGVVPKGVVPKG